MQLNIDLAKILSENSRIDYHGRIEALLKDCESMREGRKDYYTYKHYAHMLDHAATKLHRKYDEVKEDIKHGKK